MNSIHDFYKPYAELEESVRALMTRLFSSTCGECTACCCRADICEEALESAFLSKLLKEQGLSEDNMDDRYGWLHLHGCSLKYGRPPVCYAFFCDELLARLPDDEARYAARMLGRLLHYIGKKAVGGWHLVEIMNPDDLNKVQLDELSLRMKDAQQAFQVLKQFVYAGRLTSEDREILLKIEQCEDL
jgi:hypothetical protein